MKPVFVAHTRTRFHVANVLSILVLTGLIGWSFYLSGDHKFFLVLALLLMLVIPFALISIFSAMKSVRVTSSGLSISYAFKNHINEVSFKDVKTFYSKTGVDPKVYSFQDSFRLTLNDGRVFEFSSSQFDQYAKLKSVCYRSTK